MKKDKSRIPLFDLYLTAYLQLNDVQPELTLQGGKVLFEFPVGESTYRLLKKYNENPSVPVLDFVNIVRSLRARMITIKNEKKIIEGGGKGIE